MVVLPRILQSAEGERRCSCSREKTVVSTERQNLRIIELKEESEGLEKSSRKKEKGLKLDFEG